MGRNKSWMERALSVIANTSGEATGEQIRMQVEPLAGPPHHHNAWGALVRTATARGLIEFAGRYENMRTPKSHARRTPVYRFRHGRQK